MRCRAGVARIAGLLLVVGAAPRTLPAQAPACPAAEVAGRKAALQQLLDSVIAARPDIAGVSVHIEAPRHCLSWSGASGVSDRATGARLSPAQPHRMASNTKTYVAAGILRLVEDGKLSIDAPISGLLSSESVETLRKGGYQPDSIRVRHLLSHTSGLFDYAMSDPFQQAVTTSPNRRWTRAEQVRFAMEHGASYGAPGSVFHYADTGYILLGEILERVTGEPLAAALRSLLAFKQNGLASTWLETLEPAPAGVANRAHQYMGDVDTYTWDPSFDLYGGGGLAATPRDMALFVRELFTGKIYHRKRTLDLMLTPPTVPAQRDYRYGIYPREVDGVKGWGHTGFWNTFAYHFPDLDLSIAASLTQQQNSYDVAIALLNSAVRRAR